MDYFRMFQLVTFFNVTKTFVLRPWCTVTVHPATTDPDCGDDAGEDYGLDTPIHGGTRKSQFGRGVKYSSLAWYDGHHGGNTVRSWKRYRRFQEHGR